VEERRKDERREEQAKEGQEREGGGEGKKQYTSLH
jgi:hypothetical protein